MACLEDYCAVSNCLLLKNESGLYTICAKHTTILYCKSVENGAIHDHTQGRYGSQINGQSGPYNANNLYRHRSQYLQDYARPYDWHSLVGTTDSKKSRHSCQITLWENWKEVIKAKGSKGASEVHQQITLIQASLTKTTDALMSDAGNIVRTYKKMSRIRVLDPSGLWDSFKKTHNGYLVLQDGVIKEIINMSQKVKKELKELLIVRCHIDACCELRRNYYEVSKYVMQKNSWSTASPIW